MKVLLDTHVVLWWLLDDPALDRRTRAEVSRAENELWTSAVVVWEFAIKSSAGRLTMPEDLLASLERQGIGVLDVTAEDALLAGRLPLHHRDPFDRMLVAQALRRGLVLATQDRTVRRYDVPVLPPREPDPGARV